jgi:hypothetical protein
MSLPRFKSGYLLNIRQRALLVRHSDQQEGCSITSWQGTDGRKGACLKYYVNDLMQTRIVSVDTEYFMKHIPWGPSRSSIAGFESTGRPDCL